MDRYYVQGEKKVGSFNPPSNSQSFKAGLDPTQASALCYNVLPSIPKNIWKTAGKPIRDNSHINLSQENYLMEYSVLKWDFYFFSCTEEVKKMQGQAWNPAPAVALTLWTSE